MDAYRVHERALRDAHLEYYLGLAERYGDDDLGPPISELAPHHDNLRSALRWALDSGNHRDARRLCIALTSLWSLLERFREGASLIREALSLPDPDPSDRARLLLALADMVNGMGRYGEAETLRAEAAGEYAAIGDAVGGVQARLALAWSAWEQFRFKDAADRVQPLVDMLDQIDDRILRARIFELRAWIAVYLGDETTVRTFMDEASTLIDATGTPMALALHLSSKANALSAIGDDGQAEALWERVVSLYAAHAPMSPYLGAATSLLAGLKRRRDDVEGADVATGHALALASGRGEAAEAAIRYYIGYDLVTAGELDAAHAMFVEAKERLERGADVGTWYENIALALADVAYERGDVAEAERASGHVMEQLRGRGAAATVVPMLPKLARLAELRGDIVRARAYWTEHGVAPAEPAGSPGWRRARADAHVARLDGDLERARAIIEDALADARRQDAEDIVFGSLRLLATFDAEAGDLERALAGAAEAVTLAHRGGSPRHDLVLSLALLGQIHLAADDVDGMAAAVERIDRRWRDIYDPVTRAEYGVTRAHVISPSDAEGATRLLAAAQGYLRRVGYRPKIAIPAAPRLQERLEHALGDRFAAVYAQAAGHPVQAILTALDSRAG